MINNIIEKIKNLFRSKEITHVELNDILLEHDIDKFKAELRVDSLATEAASAGMPHTDSKDLDANEVKFILFFKNKINFVRIKYTDKLLAYDTRIKGIDIIGEKNKIRNYATNVKKQSNNLIDKSRATLISLQAGRRALSIELEQFKSNHQLQRTANYPESKFFNFALIAFILIVESIMNGYFFSKGHDYGLVGGISQAFIIALVNVGLGLLLGFLSLRQIHHVSKAQRILGYISCAVITIIAFSGHLLVAHYRDQLAINPEHALTLGVQAFKEGAFQLQSVDSYVLLALTAIIFIVATFKGYKFDDCYPGYGALTRKNAYAFDDYVAERSDVMQSLEDLKLESLREVESIGVEVRSKVQELNELVAMKKRIISNFHYYMDQLEFCCNAILMTYRQKNRAIRENATPSYFENKFTFSDKPSLKSDIGEDNNTVKDRTAIYEELMELIEDVKNDIEKTINYGYKSLSNTDEYFDFEHRKNHA